MKRISGKGINPKLLSPVLIQQDHCEERDAYPKSGRSCVQRKLKEIKANDELFTQLRSSCVENKVVWAGQTDPSVANTGADAQNQCEMHEIKHIPDVSTFHAVFQDEIEYLEEQEKFSILHQKIHTADSQKQKPKTLVRQNQRIKCDSTYKLIGNIKIIADILEIYGLCKTPGDNFSILWSSQHLKSYAFRPLEKNQRVNLFPHSWECTRKDALASNINRMIQTHGSRHMRFWPQCFVWPLQRDEILVALSKSPRGTPWIVKPAGSSQGKGIYIVTDPLDLPNERARNDDNWIVERYIDNPLLLDGKKFDLRLYVAVTSFDPLRIYLHQEGLVRFATEPYSNDSYDKQFVHLTNYRFLF